MKAIAIASLLLGGLSLCSAQSNISPIAPKKGTWSLGLAADWFKAENTSSVTDVHITPSYFFTDNLELGVPFGWTHTSGSDETMIGLEGRFYFMHGGANPQFAPFIGAIWQVDHVSGFSDDTFFGGEIGAHYFVANNVALTGQFIIGSDRVSGVSTSSTEFRIGFTIFFPGSK
jgi:hypothetical protein